MLNGGQIVEISLAAHSLHYIWHHLPGDARCSKDLASEACRSKFGSWVVFLVQEAPWVDEQDRRWNMHHPRQVTGYLGLYYW